jgi:hypothetical protein
MLEFDDYRGVIVETELGNMGRIGGCWGGLLSLLWTETMVSFLREGDF